MDDVPPTDLGGIVSVRTLVTEEGSVRTYSVYSEGRELASTMDEGVARSGDTFTEVPLNRPVGDAWSRVDGTNLCSGGVVPTDEQCWHIRPVEGLVEAYRP